MFFYEDTDSLEWHQYLTSLKCKEKKKQIRLAFKVFLSQSLFSKLKIPFYTFLLKSVSDCMVDDTHATAATVTVNLSCILVDFSQTHFSHVSFILLFICFYSQRPRMLVTLRQALSSAASGPEISMEGFLPLQTIQTHIHPTRSVCTS